MSERTIAAISTPLGTGGISVIRISGDRAIEIADSVFSGKTPLSDKESHTVSYGHITEKNGEPIDEVLVTVMRAPRSYTREDVVEISTHGGVIAAKRVMDALIGAGAYPAEPGEFTKRAFLNGRIDLSRAEAVIDIINAKNRAAQKNALGQAEGVLWKKIEAIRAELIGLAARMQVIIDYPDEDLEDITPEEISEAAKNAANKVAYLIKTADDGRIIKDGIKTVICGKPNVGKSSLMNLLSGHNRAIVTDIAGTTRDIIEESITAGGVGIVLYDTAGIRKTEDTVEKIGVEKTLESIDTADLITVILDASEDIDKEDEEILKKTEGKKRIVLINKCDIKDPLYIDRIKEKAGEDAIEFSAKTGEGKEALLSRIKEMYDLGRIGKEGETVITNERQLAALIKAQEALLGMTGALDGGMPSDISSIDLNIAIDSLGEITGATVSEDIVSAVFHGFCVGK